MPFLNPKTEGCCKPKCKPNCKPCKPRKINPRFVLGGLILVAIVSLVIVSSFKSRATTIPVVFAQTSWQYGVSSGTRNLTSNPWKYLKTSSGIDYLESASVTLAFDYQTKAASTPAPGVNQTDMEAIPDGEGGSIITWIANDTLYVQKLGTNGAPVWSGNGNPIDSISGSYKVTSDGAGGAILTWERDYQETNPYDNGTLYVQRINNSGVLQWPNPSSPEPVLVDNKLVRTLDPDPESGDPTWQDWKHDFFGFDMISDGNGGSFVTWTNFESSNLVADIMIQHVDDAGTILWDENGKTIGYNSDLNDEQFAPHIVSDGSGGLIVTWIENAFMRDSPYAETTGLTYNDIYGNRVLANGTPQWGTTGKRLNEELDENIRGFTMIDLGNGNIVLTYHGVIDTDGIIGSRVNATKIDGSGNRIWNQTIVEDVGNSLFNVKYDLVTDGVGGWISALGNPINKIERFNPVNPADTALWEFPFSFSLGTPSITPDGNGGAYVAFERAIPGANGITGIYTRKFSGSDGSIEWEQMIAQGTTNIIKAVFDGLGEIMAVWSMGDNGTISAQSLHDDLREKVYPVSGNMESNVMNAGNPCTWSTLDWTADIPVDTSLTFSTKTSEDNTTWSDWSAETVLADADGFSGQISIVSPKGQYFQYKATLSTTDNLVTPALQGVTINGLANPYEYNSPGEGTVTIGGDITATNSDSIDLSAGLSSQNIGDVTVGTGAGAVTVTTTQGVLLDTPPGGVVITNSNLTGPLTGTSVTIPDNTIVYGPAGWDGAIIPPKVGSPTSPPSSFKFGTTILDVGSADNVLIFSQPVLITINQSVTSLYYQAAGSSVWNNVPLCAGTFAAPVMPVKYKECYVKRPSPATTKIYTYHFTTFAEMVGPPPAYSPQPTPISEPVAPTTPEQPAIPNVPTTPGIPVSSKTTTREEILASPVPTFPADYGVGYGLGRDDWANQHRLNIFNLYLFYLGRAPSLEEVNWQLQHNSDIENIRYWMPFSPEYKAKYGGW